MKHIKGINEFFFFGDAAKLWWNNLQPHQQHDLRDKYYPSKPHMDMFIDPESLTMSDDQILHMYEEEKQSEDNMTGESDGERRVGVDEGKTFQDVKKLHPKREWDPNKKDDFRKQIKNLVKSKGYTTKQVGNDLEVICDEEMVAQVMFRQSYVGIKKSGDRFTKEFKYTELGKIKSKVGEIIKSCNKK